jgi:hypothetical protein
MRCRRCGAEIPPDATLAQNVRPARCFEDSIYRCSCGAGYSNARDPAARRLIWSAPERNVPAEVAGGLQAVLDASVNVNNREKKRGAFCSETSEDAVTWTVFRALEQLGRLEVVLGDGETAAPDLLLWGVPVSGTACDTIAAALASVSADIGEGVEYRSEPDVTLAWADRIVVVEAKYRSPNERAPNRTGFARYLGRPEFFASGADLAGAGFYELTRNWRIGVELAERLSRSFMLMNLGPPAIEASARAFSKLVNQGNGRRFRFLSWAALLERAEAESPLPAWLSAYTDERGLRG